MRKAVLSLTVLPASKRMTLTLFAACLVAMVALFGVGMRSAETQTTTTSTPTYYKVEDLGILGGSASYPSAINDSGQVVGWSYNSSGESHAFLYDDSTNGMKDLGTLGGTSSEAKGINKSGQVVGRSYTSGDQNYHAFLYDSTNGMKDLSDLIPAGSGWTIWEAAAIKTDGKIAASGYGGNTPPDPNVCPYSESGIGPAYGAALVLTPTTTANYEVQDLGTLGSYFSKAMGINNPGQVVGYSHSDICTWAEQAFFYDANASPKMQGLAGEEAKGINDSGQAVGYATKFIDWTCIDYDCWRAFLYDSATKQMKDLGNLRGGDYPRGVFGSVANGINNSGKVVGESGTSDGSHHAFLYDSTNGMIDLNTLLSDPSGWTIYSASAISTDGKIAAYGSKDRVSGHALLLTPTSDVPPPKITSPQNNTYDTDGSFSVSGSAVAGSTVELFEGTTSKGTTKTYSSSGAWSIDLSGVSEGTHTYSAKAKDAAGNTSSASNTVTLTVDKTAPKVSSVSPTSGAKNVALNTSVAATFSEAIDPKTLITTPTDQANPNVGASTTFTLVKSGTTTPISAKVSYDDSTKKVTLTPSSALAAGTKYTAKLSGGVKDLAGNALVAYSWSFTTVRQ